MQKGEFTAKLKKKFSLGGVTLWGAVLFVFLIVFDLATKALAEKYLSGGKAVRLAGDFVVLRLVYNRGISFGMFSDGSVGAKVAIIVITAIMMLALTALYLLLDKRRKTLRISLVFVVAGGIGNLIDRIAFKMWLPDGAKGVRDMVDVSGIKFGSFNFGICNFADFFITAGAILLILSFLFFDSEALFPTKKSKALAETLAAATLAAETVATETVAAETLAEQRGEKGIAGGGDGESKNAGGETPGGEKTPEESGEK